MSPTYRQRLESSEQGLFVGRERELALFHDALTSSEPPFQVLFVHGAAGIGKSMLLRQMLHCAQACGVPAALIDGAGVALNPGAFVDAAARSLGCLPSEVEGTLKEDGGRRVLLVDSYERLLSIDSWFRESFLAQCSDRVVTVVASQVPPPLAWRSGSAWQALVRPLALSPLTDDEARSYLRTRGLNGAHLDRVIELTEGYPLALALVADSDRRGNNGSEHQLLDAAVTQELLERLLPPPPGPEHREALEVTTVAHVTTEDVLKSVLGAQHVAPLFGWLRSLPFMRSDSWGLFPDHFARSVLLSDLRWRSPDRFDFIQRQLHEYYLNRIPHLAEQDLEQNIVDLKFLMRGAGWGMRPGEWPTTLPPMGRLEPMDHEAVVTMACHAEGPAMEDIARHWMRRQPEAFTVFRGIDDEPVGFVAALSLSRVTEDDITVDPGIPAALECLRGQPPLTRDEEALYFRFLVVSDASPGAPQVRKVLSAHMVNQCLHTPRLAFGLISYTDPPEGLLSAMGLLRLPDADFAIGELCFRMYGIDWRVLPPQEWLRVRPTTHLTQEARLVLDSIVLLSHDEFVHEAQEAVKNVNSLTALTTSRLLHTRLVVNRTGRGASTQERVRALQTIIEESIRELAASPRSARLYTAFHRMYLEPAGSVREAARLLDIPFSTYRRSLADALTRLAEIMWEQETGHAGA